MVKNFLINYYMENHELNIEKVVNEYNGYVYTIIKNIVNNSLSSEDIDELILDTFFVIWSNKEKLSTNLPIAPYLAGIVKNLIKKKYRTVQFNENIEDYENILITEEDIFNTIEEREKNKIIANALKKMKTEDQSIFRLFYYYAKKTKEISQELNLSEFNVKSRLHRIRHKLKKILIESGYGNE